MYRILILLLICPLVIAQSTNTADRYTAALAGFKARLYVQAEKDFRELLQEESLQESLRDNCWYWIGECHYAKGAWLDALAEFSRVVGWPGSNKMEAAQLKIALCWQNLDENARACRTARAMKTLWPAGEYTSQAERMIRNTCD